MKRIAAAAAACAVLASGATPAGAGPEDELISLLLRADDVIATGVSPTSIMVQWTDNSLVETAYRVEMARDEAGPYREVQRHECFTHLTSFRGVELKAPSFGQQCATSFQTGPASDPKPLFVRVVPVVDVNGVTILEGPPSLPDPALLGPVPPSDLRCNGGGDSACTNVNSVTLTWVDNSDEAEFWIMRARSNGSAGPPNFGTKPHAVVPANTTEFHEFLAEFSTTFFYRVVAVRRQNIPRLDGTVTIEESFSNSLAVGNLLDHVKVVTAPVPPPSDPSSLAAEFIPPSTAKLTWVDKQFDLDRPYIDEDGWFIDFGPGTFDFEFTTSKLPKPGQGSVTFVDDDIPPDTLQCYRVRGWRGGPAYSGFTNTACIGSIPKKPGDLVATALDNAHVKLAWRDRSNAETSFVIQRCKGNCSHSDSGWKDVGEAPADSETFTDDTTLGETRYSYRVFAANSSGRSAASNIARVTTPQSPVEAPTNLIATPTGSHEITLNWIDNSMKETGFRVEFKVDGQWETLAERGPKVGTGTVTYVDDWSLGANMKRCYRVRALKVNKVSDPSNVDCATTFKAAAPDGKPTNLTATVVSNVRIDLSWKDNASNEDGFRVEVIRFPNQACPQNPNGLSWAEIAEAPKKDGSGTIANFAVKGLQPHTAHFFRVIAVNRDGESDPSNVTGCAETLGPPLPVFIDPATSGDIETTRCHVDIEAPAIEVDRVKLLVNAYIPDTGVNHTDVVWIEEPRDGDIWRATYKFRRGVVYGLIARSFGPPPNAYHSAEAGLSDIKVLADCPLEPDPI